MRSWQDGVSALTRRLFCWSIAGASARALLDPAGVSELPSKDEGPSSEYVVINGWVLTSEDVLYRQERL